MPRAAKQTVAPEFGRADRRVCSGSWRSTGNRRATKSASEHVGTAFGLPTKPAGRLTWIVLEVPVRDRATKKSGEVQVRHVVEIDFGARFVGVAAGLGGRFAAFLAITSPSKFSIPKAAPALPAPSARIRAAAAARAPRKRGNEPMCADSSPSSARSQTVPVPGSPRAVGCSRLAGERYVLNFAFSRERPGDPLRGRRAFDHRMLCRCCGLGGRPPAPPYLFFLPFLQRLFFSTGFSVVLRPFCPRMLALER